MTMPAQKPGRSRQDYETPHEFIKAIEHRFGKLELDLAARSDNARAQYFISPQENSLAQDWGIEACDRLWLNPPFGDIAPWARKCAETTLVGSKRIFLLVPASVGSRWYADHVHDKARVYFLSPRLSFDGKHPFPKDCILSVYGEQPGFELWRWRP